MIPRVRVGHTVGGALLFSVLVWAGALFAMGVLNV
jgi:hypothetical protein